MVYFSLVMFSNASLLLFPVHHYCSFSAISDRPSPEPSPLRMTELSIEPNPPASSVTFRTGRSNQNSRSNDHDSPRNTRTTAAVETETSGSSAARLSPVEVLINNIAGNGICGILYKWVNCARGWRPRWFVLQDGVLSYYKINGPDKIVVDQEIEKESKVIGVESFRKISEQRNGDSGSNSLKQLRRKPFGEIHLMVSSISESQSDEKRFSIYTGTMMLRLRAERREDREAWIEALKMAKGMLLMMSKSELMSPVDTVIVSTEKLRQRLLEEGVSEAAIGDSEQIMESEFTVLQNQLLLLKQKHWLLIDSLQQLEVHNTRTTKLHTNPIRNPSSASSHALQIFAQPLVPLNPPNQC